MKNDVVPCSGLKLGGWLLGKVAVALALLFCPLSMMCLCGQLMFGRTTTALVLVPLFALYFFFLCRCWRCYSRWRAGKTVLRRVLMLFFSIVSLAFDGLAVFMAGYLMLKVFGFGDEYFADNLQIPSDIEVCESVGDDFVEPDACSATNGVPRLDYSVHTKICCALVNPHEPGSIYAKALEVTTGRELSDPAIRRHTRHEAPWSKNEDELFWNVMHVFIEEGRSSAWYAARIEIWFSPASGADDRKLMEKVYRVHGKYHD